MNILNSQIFANSPHFLTPATSRQTWSFRFLFSEAGCNHCCCRWTYRNYWT